MSEVESTGHSHIMTSMRRTLSIQCGKAQRTTIKIAFAVLPEWRPRSAARSTAAFEEHCFFIMTVNGSYTCSVEYIRRIGLAPGLSTGFNYRTLLMPSGHLG